MKFRIFTIISILTILVLSACAQKGIKDAKNWEIADFTFTDQNNNSFGLADLKGKIWVADFIFTNCEDVCMPMTANMVKLQQMVKDKELKNVEFVSFSVDPAVDTPEVLTAYAKQYNADTTNWHFLTGFKQVEIEKFGMDYFKTIIKKPQTGDQVIHQTYFYLIDQEGKIMKVYPGLADIPFDEILKDIKALQ
ncbi:SCO family protein [Bacillus sp. FJAT-29790]|uniref:SCO family protein n=1 Tax=Bacillus sp. FJAT-29790 TaxID=1895002 RepID=UPI001C21E7E0|nr:SCO family protein [Bacillus sp. FJAT-29790]MBU8878941.1 SCO family protein [Bacillus sp. FJAT-29790]